MKNIIKISSALALMAILCISCAKEYLDTYPDRYVEEDVIFTTTDSAQIAVNGLSRLMSVGYVNSGECGEPAIMLYYGNYPGNDFQKCNRTTMSYLINQTYHLQLDSSYDVYPWFYYYKIILNANKILKRIDAAKGTEAEKLYIKAQALTFRAYSYFKLSELYCHRWCDTNGSVEWLDEQGQRQTYTGFGAATGLPIRLEPTTGDLACSFLFQVRDRVYTDLDDAIAYFKLCGFQRTSDEYYKTDIHVAYGIYARAALTWMDYQKAAEYAPMAREGFDLMSNDEYCESGFNKPNREWIWGTYDAVDMNLGTQSFYSYMASNGTTVNCISYPSAISKDLYTQIPATDVRKKLYLEPKTGELDEGFNNNNGRSTGPLAVRAKEEYREKLYIDKKDDQLLSAIFIYMQFKFQASNLPAVGNVVLMRAAEMYYIEAEALYNLDMSSNKTKIQNLLKELNAERDPSYKDSGIDKLSGSKLKEEIFRYRRFDLWGEGFDWFDYKRWNYYIDRKSLSNGGSFHKSFARQIAPGGANEWTWIIPRRETDYNKLIVVIGGQPEEPES